MAVHQWKEAQAVIAAWETVLDRAATGRLTQLRKREPAIPSALKYVDPDRPRSLFSRAYASFSNTRIGRFVSAKLVWKVDSYLLRATRGRVGIGLVLPTALLETRGAKSGKVRRNGVIYFHDAERVKVAWIDD
jgi:F420H(2)-dependent quinone reductase